MQHIYLSPHFDDIAFSLSTKIQAGGTILDVFTISNYVENACCLDKDVSDIRKREEKSYVKTNDLKYEMLKLPDSGLNGCPFSRYHVVPINTKLEKELLDAIFKLNTKSKIDTLFCPMGVGKHLDHLQLFLIIQKHYVELKKEFNIVFYAEVPYIFYQNSLKNREYFLKKWLHKNHIKKHKHLLSKHEIVNKIKNLKKYKSQFSEISSNTIFNRISDSKARVIEITYY